MVPSGLFSNFLRSNLMSNLLFVLTAYTLQEAIVRLHVLLLSNLYALLRFALSMYVCISKNANGQNVIIFFLLLFAADKWLLQAYLKYLKRWFLSYFLYRTCVGLKRKVKIKIFYGFLIILLNAVFIYLLFLSTIFLFFFLLFCLPKYLVSWLFYASIANRVDVI